MITIFLVGAALFSFGLLFVFSEAQGRKNAVRLKGSVAGFVKEGTTKSTLPTYRSVVRFQTAGGQGYYLVNNTGSTAPLNKVNDPAYVWFKNGDPASAIPDSKVSYTVASILMLIGGGNIALFFKVSSFDLFSIGTSLAVLAFLGRGLWKIRRKIPLTKEQFRELKFHNSLSGRLYRDDQAGEIPWVDPTQLSASIEKSLKYSQLMVVLGFGVGFLLAGFSAHLAKQEKAFLDIAVPTSGTVVELKSKRTSKGTKYYPVVEFTVPETNQKIRFEHPIRSKLRSSYSVGQEVPVLMDPQQPNIAQIDMGIWNYLMAGIVGIFGLIFILAGYSSLQKLKKLQPGPGNFNRPTLPPSKLA